MNQNGNEVMIELNDPRSLSAIALDFENCKMLKKTSDENKAGVYEVYEGYTELFYISRSRESKTVRIMLKKP